MVTLNIYETFLKYRSNLGVFNMSKTSNMYILNIYLKHYCAVWAKICYQDANREEGIVGVDYTGINNYIIIT